MERPRGRFIRSVGFANLLNLVLFQVLFIVAAMLRPGYSPVSQPASDLGIGPSGEWVDAAVIVLALLKIGLGLAFFMLMRPMLGGVWRSICALLIALPGLGNIVTAVFTEAPATLVIHSLASAVVVLACVLMFFVVGAVLWRAPDWHGFAVFSVLAGVVFVVLAVFLYLTFAPTSSLSALHVGGLSERAVILWRDVWYAVLGWHFFKWATTAAGERPVAQEAARATLVAALHDRH
jgi:Protein of unknown function (DUF998)